MRVLLVYLCFHLFLFLKASVSDYFYQGNECDPRVNKKPYHAPLNKASHVHVGAESKLNSIRDFLLITVLDGTARMNRFNYT